MPAVVVAPLETKPPKTASTPSESEERRSEEVKVELAMLMRPPVNPTMVEVETPYSVALKGKVEASARVPPKETTAPPVREPAVVTVIEEFASWLFPIEEVATTLPVGSVARSEERIEVKARLVVVAEVVVALVAKVEEAIRESGEPVSQRPVEVATTAWVP